MTAEAKLGSKMLRMSADSGGSQRPLLSADVSPGDQSPMTVASELPMTAWYRGAVWRDTLLPGVGTAMSTRKCNAYSLYH